MANETTTATSKKLVKNLATMVKKVGFDEQEIDGRIMSIIPNAKPEGVGVGGNKVDLSYTLPWVLDKNQVKKKKFAEEVAETAQSNVVIKEVGLTLYILDEVEGEINISISADVRWINTFFGTTELDSYTLIEQVVPIQEATPVEVNNSGGEIMAGNLLLQEFIEKIASRPNVKLTVKIDKYTPFPVSFDVDENGFEQVSVRFENNATKFRANFRLSGPFSELQSKTYSFCHYLDTIGFDVTQEGLGAVVKGEYDNGDISIVNDLVTLLDKIKAFSYNHANSFEAWAKKHKYGYTEAKVFFQVRDIIPNYDGDAIVYKSGKSNYIAIPNDVEGIDGFIDAVKHAYTPDKAGAFYRFYFPNLEEMQKFVEFANKIEKPSKVEVEKEVKPEPSLKNAYVKKGNTPPKSNGKPIKEPKNLVYVAFKNRIANLPEVHLNAELDDNDPHIVGFQVSIKGYQQFDVGFYENYSRFNVRIMFEGSIMELEKPTKDLCQAFVTLGFDAKLDGFAISINYKFHPENNMFVTKLEQIMNIAKQFAKVKLNKPQSSAQDLGGVAPNNEPIREPVNTQEPKGIVVEKGERAIDKVNFAKGQKYEVTEVTLGLKGEPDYNTYEIEVLSIFANGKVRCKNLTLGYEFKIGLEPTNKRKIYRILQDVPEMKKEIDKLKDKITKDEVNKILGKDKEVPVEVPVQNEVEPPNREVERTYKTGKVKDPEHKAQLDRMKAYIKKIADVVDADNDFALRFLEEPKEFQKYKLPTVGVGLFYYGDKSATELEQNALYKKVYRGRGLSILRKFFKTTDLNGEKCLLVLFVDAQYAKETKAKLIKESFELGNKVRINGRLYKVNAIYEHKFAIETIAGLMYIDMDSDLIDITIEED